MYYILKASPKAFFIVEGQDIVITSDYTRATKYNTIGEAMKMASKVNGTLGTHLVKVESLG